MRQRGLTNGDQWWGMLAVGEVMHVWGQGTDGKSLHLPLTFAGKLKFFLKKLRLLKNAFVKKQTKTRENITNKTSLDKRLRQSESSMTFTDGRMTNPKLI